MTDKLRTFAADSDDLRRGFEAFLAHTDQKIKARAWLDRFVAALPARRLFIDAGAGNGLLTAAFADRFDKTIAIEPDQALRAKLTEACPSAQVLSAGILEAKPAGQADLVLCSHVLYHVEQDQWQAALEYMASWLAPGGSLLVLLQDVNSDGQKMQQRYLGLRFDLAGAAREFEARHGQRYEVAVEVMPARVITKERDTALTIVEFMLNLVPRPMPTRAEVQEYIEANFNNADGYEYSCDQTFVTIRAR